MIYLDYAATTPMSEQALKVFAQVSSSYYGNVSSLHDIGADARQIYRASAAVIAKAMGAHEKEIHFTSGATESNFLAIQALLDGSQKSGKHIITTEIEHSSVIQVFERLEKQGYEVSWLGVNKHGRVELSELQKIVRNDTVLVSLQHVNSELGTIQPLKEIGTWLEEQDILFHCDAVQSFGKMELNVHTCKLDALCVSAHKIYGPKGVGAVYLNAKKDWKPFLESRTQAKALKYGTVNVPGIAAFAASIKEALAMQKQEYERIQVLRKHFIERLQALDYTVVIEGDENEQSPYILGLRFPGMEGQFLMLECSQAGLGISTGSACQVGSDRPNRTVKALGRSDEEAREFVRCSFGRFVKEDDLEQIIAKIDSILKRHFSKVNRTLANVK